MRLTVSSLIKVIATAGLLGVLFMHYDPLEATGRRLFAHPLEEELSYDPSETSLGSYGSYGSYGSVGGQPWSDYGRYQVEQLIAPHDLLKLFKTAAGSPQDALQRMAVSGAPSEAEWTSALQDWKWGLTRREISSIFHGIDVDGDGKVTLAELLSCFRHGYQGTIPRSQARFHEQLWQCFVDQSWPDKELVVVETYTKKEKPSEVFTKLLKAKEKRLKYLGIQVDENDDLTVGAKRNMTVLMCSGQYCVNFDDDDLYATVYVERMVNELRQRSLVALTLSAWHNFFESNCRCGYSTPACWEPEDEEEYEGILYGYGFSYVYLRALALSFPYPNLGFAEDAPFMLKLREKMGAGRVGLKEDMEGLCLHIVHPSSSTPDPEIETMLTEDELNGLVVSDSLACRLHLKRPWFPSIWSTC